MHRSRLICVVTAGISEARCKYCRDRIVWATTASQRGKPSRTLPFTWPRPFPLRQERNDETGIGFEYWPAEKLHFVTCPHQPVRKKKATSSLSRGVRQ